MINRKELRIGNIFIDPWKDRVYFIIRTDADIEDAYSLQRLKGYPLSEEQLLKRGFIKIGDSLEYKHPDTGFTLNQIGDYYGSEVSADYQHAGTGWNGESEIRYWHQLQNLYFDVTGKELITHPPQSTFDK